MQRTHISSPLAYIVYLIFKYTQVFHSIQLLCARTHFLLCISTVTLGSPRDLHSRSIRYTHTHLGYWVVMATHIQYTYTHSHAIHAALRIYLVAAL